MGEPATGDEQRLRQRTMRKLAVALALIVAAIVGLGLLDHYSGTERVGVPQTPPAEPPPIATLPQPEPLESGPPAAEAPATPSTPTLPPPEPPAVEVQPPALAPAQTREQPPAPAEAPRDSGRAPTPGPVAPTAETSKAPSRVTTAPPGHGPATGLDGRQGFVVQLGMFTTVENAQALQARLKDQGIPAFLETRVVVGPFRDRAEVDAAQRKLKELGVAGVVVQRK